MELLKSSKGKIVSRLDGYLKEKAQSYSEYGFSQDMYDKLYPFATNGKMVRGSLFLKACELFWENTDEELVDVACAIELLHTGFLIQDDIMDKDVKRRGLDCIHVQYGSDSLAMCLADIAFFFSFELMAKHAQVLPFMTSMMTRTGLGQMLDVHPESLDEKSVVQVYEAKTAYYTFYLPLGLAALINTHSIPEDLLDFSKHLGLIFQITDDMLGYDGDPTKTGKGVGSDIAQRKYTLYISYLLKVANEEDKSKIITIYASSSVSKEDINMIHFLYDKYNAGDYLNKQLTYHQKEIESLLSKSDYNEKAKMYIAELMRYLVSRCS